MNDTGVLHGIIHTKFDLGASGMLVRLALPMTPVPNPVGQFLLARPCPDDEVSRLSAWSLYARRPLYVADTLPQPSDDGIMWNLVLPDSDMAGHDAGDGWLRAQSPGTRLNLTGPFGKPLAFAPQQRTLLVVADPDHLLICLPAIHQLLDQGGRATLILLASASPAAALLRRIPIPVEVHTADSLDSLQGQIAATLRWADALLVALPRLSTTWLAQAVRTARFRLEPGYAHVFQQADYLCGYGACYVCSVPAGDGYTRACQHGPFLPLDALVG